MAMSEEEDDDLEDDSLDLDDDEDDLDDDLLSEDGIYPEDGNQSYGDEGGDSNLTKGVDLDDLQTYHNQHFGGELNASTADFNKEIKQINQQLMSEGHLVDTSKDMQAPPISSDSPIVRQSDQQTTVEEEKTKQSTTSDPMLIVKQGTTESACSDQIDAQEINVVVPERSSRYTNRQHHATAGQ